YITIYFSSLQRSAHLRHLHSFPTRRSSDLNRRRHCGACGGKIAPRGSGRGACPLRMIVWMGTPWVPVRKICEESLRVVNRKYSRSEEHTSELQSRENLVCRLLIEKKKKKKT